MKSRLLTDGLCGFTVKRISSISDNLPEETVESFTAKGKLANRLIDKELY
ncbi:MAG: hypothetical protein ACE5KO_05085 [Candidatus Bathyarchaeia archaeon]